jgi:hypothetical protein
MQTLSRYLTYILFNGDLAADMIFIMKDNEESKTPRFKKYNLHLPCT